MVGQVVSVIIVVVVVVVVVDGDVDVDVRLLQSWCFLWRMIMCDILICDNSLQNLLYT